MNVSKETILGALPPFNNQWTLLHPDQTVKDIIHEVLDKHEEFASDYDKIALYFNDRNIEKICVSLYDFCKENLPYAEETEDVQTVRSPGALLSMGHCDCKGYANFCGGVLSALNRAGKKINWNYRFASYDLARKTPHHVFIVVNDNGSEIWIDPTPGSELKEPVWQVDKKMKDMALYKISGIDEDYAYPRGTSSIGVVVSPNVDTNNINYDGHNQYGNAFGHHLGLSAYAEYENDIGTDWNSVASQINSQIAMGASPGHTVTPDFVKWVFDNNIRFWNFFYPGGVAPGFADSVNNLLPSSWPRPVVTQDGRLTFDRDIEVDDYRNAEIHILNAALQDLINRYDGAPYPLKPRDVKLFSQEHHWGNPNDVNANLFKERRGTSDVTKTLHTINKVINVVKNGVLKVVGAIPRNAFLGLVAINAFGMAGHLQNSIDAGHWEHIAKIWKDLGGNPGKLQSTIAHGSKKARIDDTSTTVDENTVGVIQLAAILAAAAPIIAALSKFLGGESKVQESNQSYVDRLNAANPGHVFSIASDGTLLEDGAPVQHIGEDEHKTRNMLIGAGVAMATYLLLNKKGKKPNYLLPAAAGLGIYLVLHSKSVSPSYLTQYNDPGATAAAYQKPELDWQGIIETGLNIFSQQTSSSSASSDYALPVSTTPGGDVA